jgi:VanZ family protein
LNTTPSHAAVAQRGVRFAWILAGAYTLVICYASLQPFSGWRMPPEDIRGFLSAPWPRYITLSDVMLNVIAYLPLGFLLATAARSRYAAGGAVLFALGACTMLSITMEGLQLFIPSRVASNIDVMTNTLGGLIASLAAPLFAPSRTLGSAVTRFRQAWFAPGPNADLALVLLALWVAAQLNPLAPLFGTGDVRDTFSLPAWLMHTPRLLLSTEALVVLFNLLGLGLLAGVFTWRREQSYALVGMMVGAGLVVKTAAAILYSKPVGPFAHITPGLLLGMGCGVALLYPLLKLPRRLLATAGIACLLAALAIINLAPSNPYQNTPRQIAIGSTSHVVSLSDMTRALSEIWPLLALICLIIAAGTRSRAAVARHH